MSPRHPLRINLELPELTPVQAESLWSFLDDFISDLWDAYETDLLQLEEERARVSLARQDATDQGDELGSRDYSPQRDLLDDAEAISTSDQTSTTPRSVRTDVPGPGFERTTGPER
jgi:hypothetical protein